MKEGITSSPHAHEEGLHSCDNGKYNEKQCCKAEQICKNFSGCWDHALELERAKVNEKSLVIANQNGAVNL